MADTDNPDRERFGRYQIQAELGRGAMGVVYRAHDPKINRVVAVKTISMAGQPPEEEREYRERFFREAEAAGRLSHPGIVTVFDMGEEPETRAPYLVMEFVGGQSLDKLLAREHELQVHTALQLTLELAEALDCAHAQGVVHRDLKPANILITEDGHAKIADFGIAKLNLASFTLAGRVLGTPAFMSPEQLNGDAVDGRSDLFSLGVILYTVLTGYRPFQGNSALTVSYKVVNRDPIPATVLNTDLPPGLDYIIARAMAKDPTQRYQRGAELAQDILALQEGREAPSKEKFLGSEAAAGKPPAANETTSSALAPLRLAPKSPSGTRSVKVPVPAERQAAQSLLENMRKKSFAGAFLLVGLLVLGMRISYVLWPHTAPPQNVANTAITKPAPRGEDVAAVKTEMPLAATKLRKVTARPHPLPAKAALPGSSPSAPVSPALLEIEVEHKFADASLSIWVDDTLTYTHTLEGTDKKRLVVFHQIQGHEFHAVQVSPGKHVIRVQVIPSAAKGEQSGTVAGEFVGGKETMLHVHFTKQGKIDLSLE
jgi:eukaryotic-like serine/threonine-protein kinase